MKRIFPIKRIFPMKRIFTLLLALTVSLLLAALPAMAEQEGYRVGICQLVQHAALDEATRGFRDALTERLGDQISFNEQNASGDISTCISIANGFIAEDVDLILANSTQALQAVYASTGDIPILGVSVTDYAAALDMDRWTGVTGVNVSGCSDEAPMAEQAELLRQLFPEAEKVGLLYCSAEANSVYQATIMTGHLTAMGYDCAAYTFTDTNDIYSVAQKACDACDVLFVPTDNTVAICTELLRNVVEVSRTPIVGGDEGICAGCGVATLAVDYYDLGRVAGDMACEVLTGGADVGSMPVQFGSSFSRVYNAEMCRYLGIEVPDSFEPIA